MASRDLTDAEQAQWDHYLAGQIDIWAQLFDLHDDGLISDEKWAYWDDGYWRAWETGMYKLIWEKNAAVYDRSFQEYIEAGRRKASADGE